VRIGPAFCLVEHRLPSPRRTVVSYGAPRGTVLFLEEFCTTQANNRIRRSAADQGWAPGSHREREERALGRF